MSYGLRDTTLAIVSYIWKVHNDKAFNGKDTSPLETVQIAKSKAESLRLAQIIEEPHEDEDGGAPHTTPTQSAGPVCSIDASWHKDDNFFGGGMVMTEDGMTTFGSFASNRVLTSYTRSSKL